MNTQVLSGIVVADASIKSVGDTNIIEFSMANNDKQKKKEDGSYESVPIFVDVSYWSKGGKMVNHLKKGKKLVIQGRLDMNRWEKEGQKKSKIYITAFKVEPFVMDSANGTPQQQAQTPDIQFEEPTDGQPF